MSIETVTALVIALTTCIGAISVLVVQLRGLRKDIDGRMGQLVQLAGDAGRKEGELAGRDFAASGTPVSVMGGAGTPVPLTPIEPKA